MWDSSIQKCPAASVSILDWFKIDRLISIYLAMVHTTIGQTQVDFVDFHR